MYFPRNKKKEEAEQYYAILKGKKKKDEENILGSYNINDGLLKDKRWYRWCLPRLNYIFLLEYSSV